MKYLKSCKGFTLAEVLITLVLLGVVAAITIPATMNKNQESANRAKLKKALANYETVMNNIVVENVLKSDADVTNYANAAANCENTRKYFKSIKNVGNNGCVFRSPDGLYWNIADILHPTVSFNEANINNVNLKTDNSEKTTFGFVAYFDQNGSLRIADYTYSETAGDDKVALKKLYTYLKYNLDDTISCSGENCCASANEKGQACIQKDVACRTTANRSGCAGAYMPSGWGCANITAGDNCNAIIVRDPNNAISPIVTIQYDGDKVYMVVGDGISDSDWQDMITLTKNPDGTMTYHADSPYSGGAINEIIYDANGEIIKFRNYDRSDCTRNSCNWESNPFDYLDEIRYGGGFLKTNGQGCAVSYCGRGAGFTTNGAMDSELVKKEIEKLLGKKL